MEHGVGGVKHGFPGWTGFSTSNKAMTVEGMDARRELMKQQDWALLSCADEGEQCECILFQAMAIWRIVVCQMVRTSNHCTWPQKAHFQNQTHSFCSTHHNASKLHAQHGLHSCRQLQP